MYIAVCGPSGAGKDTVADLLAAKGGYAHVSGGDILREMLTSLGLEPKKSALGPFGVFIRENYGLEPLFARVMQKAAGKNGVIITGIRSPDEAMLVKSRGGKVIYIDAPAELRYRRVISRSRKSDVLSPHEFELLDVQEFSGKKGTEQNLRVIQDMADTIIVNDGSLADLEPHIDRILNA